jgi:hypothetical protein
MRRGLPTCLEQSVVTRAISRTQSDGFFKALLAFRTDRSSVIEFADDVIGELAFLGAHHAIVIVSIPNAATLLTGHAILRSVALDVQVGAHCGKGAFDGQRVAFERLVAATYSVLVAFRGAAMHRTATEIIAPSARSRATGPAGAIGFGRLVLTANGNGKPCEQKEGTSVRGSDHDGP